MRSFAALICACVLASMSFAQRGTPVVMKGAELAKLNLFLLNFAEAGLGSFDAQHPLSQDQLLEFVVNHVLQNRKMHSHVMLTKAQAQEIVNRYLGRKLTLFHASSGFEMVKGKLDFGVDDEEGQGILKASSKQISRLGNGDLMVQLVEVQDGHPGKKHTAWIHTTAGRYVLVGWAGFHE